MRFTVAQAAQAFDLEEDRLTEAVDSGLINTDDANTLDARLVLAWKRATSDEAQAMFGDTIQLPASEIAYVEGVSEASIEKRDRAGEAHLELTAYQITQAGRTIVQTADVHDWAARHGGRISDHDRGIIVLIRTPDLSRRRALLDSFMLGDARLRFAIAQLVADGKSRLQSA